MYAPFRLDSVLVLSVQLVTVNGSPALAHSASLTVTTLQRLTSERYASLKQARGSGETRATCGVRSTYTDSIIYTHFGVQFGWEPSSWGASSPEPWHPCCVRTARSPVKYVASAFRGAHLVRLHASSWQSSFHKFEMGRCIELPFASRVACN
jgi:hypothetical protein